MRRRIIWLAVMVTVVTGYVFYRHGRGLYIPLVRRLGSRDTLASALARYGPAAEARLRPAVERAGLDYPPYEVALIAFKEERQLEVWGRADGGVWRYVRAYPILGASGHAGPKRREGDRQVPEGVYHIDSLNPNSSYHLSMRLDYPNAFDHAKGRGDGRTDLGGDIFIHGCDLSIGCLAMGDEAIEDLFTLVAAVGLERVRVLIAPNDLRAGRPPVRHPEAPPWTDELYAALRTELAPFDRGREDAPNTAGNHP